MTSLPVANFRWKGPTRGIVRNFRLGMRTPFSPFGWPSVTGSHGTCTTTLVVIQNVPVAHAHTIVPVTDFTSGEKASLGLLRNFRLRMRITFFRFRSRYFRWRQFRSHDFRLLHIVPHKYDFVRTHILLMYLHLNNWEFCRVKSENMTLFMLSLIFYGNVLFLCLALDKK